jgi:DNA-binding NarL/FixJ family response regulator
MRSVRSSAALRTQLDEATFNAAWAEGRAMTMEQAIAEAMRPVAADAPASTAHHGPDDLSPREREVLLLVAQGLSDAQVADRVVMSPRTVNAHLTTIYRKLGVNSRGAATRYALDHHIV